MSKSYYEKLKDPRWQKKRLEILNRDDFTCHLCNETEKTLHVHHIAYLSRKNPWDYDDAYLITLCDSCHELEHKAKVEYEKQIVDMVINNGLDFLTLFEILSYVNVIISFSGKEHLLKLLESGAKKSRGEVLNG